MAQITSSPVKSKEEEEDGTSRYNQNTEKGEGVQKA